MLTRLNVPRSRLYLGDAQPLCEPTEEVRQQVRQQLDAQVFLRVWREVRDQIKWSLLGLDQVEEPF